MGFSRFSRLTQASGKQSKTENMNRLRAKRNVRLTKNSMLHPDEPKKVNVYQHNSFIEQLPLAGLRDFVQIYNRMLERARKLSVRARHRGCDEARNARTSGITLNCQDRKRWPLRLLNGGRTLEPMFDISIVPDLAS